MPIVYNLKVKLQVYVHFPAVRNQNRLAGSKLLANRQDIAFLNQAEMLTDLSNQVNDVTYGSKII